MKNKPSTVVNRYTPSTQGRGKRTAPSSRPAWSTQYVPGQSMLDQ